MKVRASATKTWGHAFSSSPRDEGAGRGPRRATQKRASSLRICPPSDGGERVVVAQPRWALILRPFLRPAQPTLSGLVRIAYRVPRALPWAGMACPLGALTLPINQFRTPSFRALDALMPRSALRMRPTAISQNFLAGDGAAGIARQKQHHAGNLLGLNKVRNALRPADEPLRGGGHVVA